MGIAGLNTTGTNNPDDYNLKRGILMLALLDSVTGLPQEYRDLGNCPSFTISFEVEELEHASSRQGLRFIDKRIVISQTANIAFVLEEISAENLALFLSGETNNNTNPAIAGIGQYLVTSSSVKGRWYPIQDASGNRALDITAANVTVVYDLAGSNDTLVLGTDYTVDEEMGMVFLLSTSVTAVDGETLHFTLAADAGAGATVQTQGQTVSPRDYALKFLGENPADDDRRFEVEIHSAKVSPDGDFNLISESDLTQMSFTGAAQQNVAWPGDSKTITITALRA